MKLKKTGFLTTIFLLAMCVVLLAGCGHTHEWTEANCTTAKTCVECGEIEGEALGHQLSEANYQSAAQCRVCGAIVGEALTPDFVTYGIETDLFKVGDSAEYLTTTVQGSGEISGTTTLTSYDIVPSHQEIEAREGYECRVAVLTTEFGKDALLSGANAMLFVTDYNNIALLAENEDRSNPIYSASKVNYNGEEQMAYLAQKGNFMPQGDKLVFTLTVCAQVPVGYDGIVCGLVKGGICETVDYINNYYTPENFVLFRMGN